MRAMTTRDVYEARHANLTEANSYRHNQTSLEDIPIHVSNETYFTVGDIYLIIVQPFTVEFSSRRGGKSTLRLV